MDNASETQIEAAVQEMIQPGLDVLWIFYYGATTTDPRNQTPLLLGPQAPSDLAEQYKTGLSTQHLLNISPPTTQLVLNGVVGPKAWATEVTQGQWQAVKTLHPELPAFPKQDASCIGADCPVVNVNWSEARAYCHAIGGELPTETQWEYAAHAGTETDYYWGDKLEDACRYGNVPDITAQQTYYCRDGVVSCNDGYGGDDVASCNDGYVGIAPVAQYLPNSWGLYDTAGNVWEWKANEYIMDYSKYQNYADKTKPDGVINYTNFSVDSVVRGFRGGSFSNWTRGLRPTDRVRNGDVSRNWFLGFRCVHGPALQPA